MLLALNYHRIGRVAAGEDFWGLTVSEENFSSHLGLLKQTFEIADPRNDALEALALSDRAYVLVTCDDGYADNLHKALPLLEQHQVPAVIFLPSEYIGRPYFWWDAVEAMFRPANKRAAATDTARLQLIWSLLLKQPPAQREFEIKKLIDLSGGRRVDESCRPLTREEVLDLARSYLISFGGHTRTHAWLPHLSSEEMRNEVEGGMQDNVSLTRRVQVAFAYPFGAVCAKSKEVVAEAGFSIGFTTVPPSGAWNGDLLAHPRLPVGNWSGSEFRDRLKATLASCSDA